MASVFDVLRSLKMSADASLLAVKLNMHDYALSMMVEDLGRYGTAIKYISKRPPAEACRYIEKYGRDLFEACPEEAMELLRNLVENCNGEFDPAQLLKVFVNDFTKSADFIEFALKKVSGSSRSILLDTILDLRLRGYAEKKLTDSECDKYIIPFIEDENIERTLQLARLIHCPPVVQYILRKLGRTKELLQYYVEDRKLQEAIALCKAEKKGDMWLGVLVYISKMDGPVDENMVQEMLEEIGAEECLHPLVVLEILARSNTLKVGAVKEYVIRWLDSQGKQIEADRKAINEEVQMMEEIDKQIESLKYNVQVLQVSKCSACDTALHLPAVHFLCRHSYHVHCFESYSEKPDVCPACTPPVSRENSKENIDDKASYQKFLKELNLSSSGMDVVSKYLRNGLFDAPRKTYQKKVCNLMHYCILRTDND
ncbi:hypothetical protein KIN20_005606 [Parelaphostrongylus tenuis]|uniref:RING-type domain-containing protein n=1 Tax=Parelaphostrongylus tenuis TaxID=148309 RepID=A0AAD5MJ58_PARTN|nr:hypothetical protein KIN20_005606 [Parelaphostrongylus tenuis]